MSTTPGQIAICQKNFKDLILTAYYHLNLNIRQVKKQLNEPDGINQELNPYWIWIWIWKMYSFTSNSPRDFSCLALKDQKTHLLKYRYMSKKLSNKHKCFIFFLWVWKFCWISVLILSGKQETACHTVTEIKKNSSHSKIFFSFHLLFYRYIKFKKVLSFVLN